jgi:glutathione S-transferase
MAPAYKLTYFDSRGLTEASRLLFKYGDIDFEDVRIKREEWPQLKETTPFGQLPVLEYKGRKVGQSIAIARYVGKLVKLAGNDDWENLEIDAVVDTFNDMRSSKKSCLWNLCHCLQKLCSSTTSKTRRRRRR